MELLNPEDGVQVFMHAIETATMMRCLLLHARLEARSETQNGRRSCQLQSSTPKRCTTYGSKQEGRKGTITHGSPGKRANRDVRRVQRTQDAIKRNTLLAEISAASENDQRLSINLWESRGRNATDAVHLLWMARWSQMKIRYGANGHDTIRSYQPQSISVTTRPRSSSTRGSWAAGTPQKSW